MGNTELLREVRKLHRRNEPERGSGLPNPPKPFSDRVNPRFLVCTRCWWRDEGLGVEAVRRAGAHPSTSADVNGNPRRWREEGGNMEDYAGKQMGIL